jgi:hypothetical protein
MKHSSITQKHKHHLSKTIIIYAIKDATDYLEVCCMMLQLSAIRPVTCL